MILVTGASGNIGSQVTRRALSLGYRVRCLVRPSSKRHLLQDLPVDICEGDLRDLPSIVRACRGIDAVISIAYISLARNLLLAAREEGVRRLVFLGSTGIYTALPSAGARAKREAETQIRQSGLNTTILRATLVYGNELDGNIYRLIRFCNRFPVFPVFGSGRAWQQPVFIDDVAHNLVAVLTNEQTYGKAYDLGGSSRLSYRDLIDTTAATLNRRLIKINIPLSLAAFAVRLAAPFWPRLGLSREQVKRLAEDKHVDISPARRDFAYQPLGFPEGVRRQVALCRRKGLL